MIPATPATAAAAALLLTLAGCASSSTTSSEDAIAAPTAPATAAPAPDATGPAADTAVRPPLDLELCFAGQQQVHLEAGREQPGAQTLVRRQREPGESRIVEEVVRFDPLPQVPPRRYTVVYTVDGERFEMAESGGAFAGSGTLLGPSWRWTGWKASYALPSGIRVESVSALGEDGALTTDQEVFGPDGRRVMTIHETGEPLSDEECARRFAAVPAMGRE